MTKSEDVTSRTTVTYAKTSSKYEKGKKKMSLGRGSRGDRGNARNNTRYSAEHTYKDYKGETEAFVALLTLKYEKVELKKYFGVFRKK